MVKTSQHPSHERFKPAPTALTEPPNPAFASNAHDGAIRGLNGGGAAVSELGLEGSFADTVLECLPLSAAWPLAQRFADNPAVQRWASLHTIGELVESLRATAHGALQAAWPIGVGVSVKGHAAGQLVGGLDGVVAGSMRRKSAGELALRVEGRGAIELEGGAIGLEVHDRFGSVHGASVGAGLSAGLGYRADAVTAFDPIEVLRLAGHLTKDLNGLLGRALSAHQLVQRMGAPLPNAPDWLGPEWTVEHDLFLQGSTGARWAPLTEDTLKRLHSVHGFTDDLLSRLEPALPFMALQSESGVVVTTSNAGTTRVEAAVSTESLATLMGAIPEIGERMSPDIVADLVEHVGVSGEATLTILLRFSGSSGVPSLDRGQSGLRVSATEMGDGIAISREEFCSLESIDAFLDGVTRGGDMEWFTDHSRTIRVDVDPQRIPEQCPDALQQLIDLTGSVLPTTASAQLVGTASLSANDLRRSWLDCGGHATLRSGDVARQAIDCAAGCAGSADVDPVVLVAAKCVRFSEARLVGGIRSGHGGGVDAAWMGVTAKTVVQAEQGLTVDVPVSKEDAERVRLALGDGNRVV